MAITIPRLIIVGIVVAVAAVVVLLNVRVSAWHRTTAAKVAQLQSAVMPKPAHFAPALLAPVPAPVARYFKRTLREAQPLIVSVRATQNAEFFANGAWRPLKARQHFTAMPPGFVWDARIEMAPLFPAHVRDAYVAGQGSMQATIFGTYSLADQSGTPELNAGALQRYLGEAVWFPTALLPGAVTWSGVDDHNAIATLADGGTTVSLKFRFDDQDRIVEISGDRFAEQNGRYTLRPWRIVCSEHAEHMGIVIPEHCEVMWLGLQGPEPYWRGRIASIVYGFN
jgi:hypothetical protein